MKKLSWMIGSVTGAMVAAFLLATPSTAYERLDRRVRIINDTDYPIERFHASNRDRASWEEDILGRYVLVPGGSVVVNVDDGSGYCVYDFKAVFSDGDVAVRRGVNVCEITSFRFVE